MTSKYFKLTSWNLPNIVKPPKIEIPRIEIPRIIIFDTTLRDGDQASGFHFRPKEKLEIARQLARLGVDVIEAGFGISGKDYEIVSSIAKEVGTSDGPIICSLARAVASDIDAAAKAIEYAKKQRIHTFIATSDIHMQSKLRKSKEQIIEMAVSAIQRAKKYVNDVEFSCEDFGRTDPNYSIEVIKEAIKAGATTINMPDTVGWMHPSESGQKVKYVIGKVRESGLDAVFSVHNHNDLGMATANTIEEIIVGGARQAEVTINGIGERAGNTSLEEVVAILKLRNLGKTNIDTKLIGETSRLVSKYSMKPQPNKAIVGDNAFAHEAGIHQDGWIKEHGTYEILIPGDYGMESRLTIGPRSGSKGIGHAYSQMGINLNEEQLSKAVERFKILTEEKKESDSADLIQALNGDESIPQRFEYLDFRPDKMNGTKEVFVDIIYDGKARICHGVGNGQVHAAINAINNETGVDYKFKKFLEESETEGSDSSGKTIIKIAKNGWEVIGEGRDTDIVESAIRGYIDGCNRMDYVESYFARKAQD